jgi:hypothetical protein
MTVSHLLDFDGLADSGLIQLLLKHLVPEGILLLVIKKPFYDLSRKRNAYLKKMFSLSYREREQCKGQSA